MPLLSLLTLLPTLIGLAASQSADDGARVRTVVIRDEVIMRVPVRPFPRLGEWQWVERKGPRCIASQDIRAAALVGPESIDFMLFDRQRIRAELSTDCPAIDFYGGFYLNTEDARVCAGRDEIRSRMGGSCGIDRFRRLERKPRR